MWNGFMGIIVKGLDLNQSMKFLELLFYFTFKYDTDASWAKTHNCNLQNIISNKFSSRYGKT